MLIRLKKVSMSYYYCDHEINPYQQGAGAIHYCVAQSKLDKVKTVKMLLKAGAHVNLLDYVSTL